jgi:hypothetical protein
MMNANQRLTAIESAVNPTACHACFERKSGPVKFQPIDLDAHSDGLPTIHRCRECGQVVATFFPVTFDGDRMVKDA